MKSIAIAVLPFIQGVIAASLNYSNSTGYLNATGYDNSTIITNSTLYSNYSNVTVQLFNSTQLEGIKHNLTILYGTDNFTTSYNFTNGTSTENLTILYEHNNFTFPNITNGTSAEKLVEQLYSIDNSTYLTDCEKCIARLELGKSVASSEPELISPAWTEWCIESEFLSEIDCELDYGRSTVENSTTGVNFVNLLTLMDPAGYDGQLYCYYQEDVCSKPKTPKVDISYMWPKKKDQHKVAPTPGNETFNVLHISDFHLEIEYQIGGEANCTESMCCTPWSTNEEKRPKKFNFTESLSYYEADGLSFYNSSYDDGEFIKGEYTNVFKNNSVWWPASTFGNYQCDAPEVLINSSLKSIVEFQQRLGLDFEFAIFTGDLVDHDAGQFIPFEQAVEEEEYSFRDMKYQLQDLPIYPVLGNHDTFPYAQLAQNSSGFSNLFDWNAELVTDLWEDYGWIDQEEERYAESHYTGFATTTKRGLKIISLNANAWYQANLYNYWNATNPDSFGQFQFLVDELVESEKNDQRVWIIAHIPFDEEALPVPAKAFASIVERFSPYTIAGIFFGHTHLDQFNILYAGNGSNNTKTVDDALNHAWISQAVTPWIDNNPSWRYYSVDTKTFSIMNSYNYFTKLNDTFTNGGAEPIWEFEYSAREAYNITNWPKTSPLNATYWHYVAQNIKNDIGYNQLYTNYETRFSPYTTECETSGLCRGNWCYVTSFTVDELDDCKKSSNVTDIFD